MRYTPLGKIILSLLLCAAILGMMPHTVVLAAEPHEDTEVAKAVFSGISLFRYYSGSLDYVLQRNPNTVKERLDKMPFANVPPELDTATDSFRTSGENVSVLVADAYEGNLTLKELIGEYRIEEAVTQANWIYTLISEARDECDRLEQATVTSGGYFKITSPSAGIDLKTSYQEVLDKIDQIREMLTLFEEILKSSPVTAEQLSPTDSQIYLELIYLELLKETEISLTIDPLSAYVGDYIHFSGLLTAKGLPLAGRQVNITLNGSRFVTVTTNSSGHYSGTLQIPYWYKHELDVQAIYYPRNHDIGIYLASLSPVIRVEVLFYESTLKLIGQKSYPGVETKISGVFDYGQSPILPKRNVQIYLDDIFISEVEAQQTFRLNIRLNDQTEVGKHQITASAAASERYAPVVTSAVLNVTLADPILDLDIPEIALIPGSIGLNGRLYSNISPLNGASIKFSMGKHQVNALTSVDGTFQDNLKTGWDFSFIGSQDLVIRVTPKEPWNAPLVNTRTLVVVNLINCSGTLIILVFLGIYLPGILRKRFGVYPTKRVRTMRPKALTKPSPVYSNILSATDSTDVGLSNSEKSSKENREPRTAIFSLYRPVIRLVQKITKTLLRPGQTLREFAKENGRVLGPSAGYFIELTSMVERLLYSPYRPTEEDAEKSRQLSNNVKKGIKK